MAAAVPSDAASGDSMAAMAGDGSGGETKRRWDAFAPHLPHAFADGDRVFVMKSRGGQRGSRPFAAAVVRGEAAEDGRRTVVYKDGSTYAARPALLVPIRRGGPLTLFTATTRAYRLAAATQDVGASVLEIPLVDGITPVCPPADSAHGGSSAVVGVLGPPRARPPTKTLQETSVV